MRAVDIIAKKRDRLSLSKDEIFWFIDAYTKGDMPDYQASALAMAIYLNGMSRDETVNLTLAMAQSGDQLDLSDIVSYAVDKHSSGGVGDKTTLVVLPLVAACGVPVAKMSGRGLGFTGGTLDKLESIAGFNVNFTPSEFRQLAAEHGLVLAGQTGELAPADGKIYALRDVTATVDSLPLIASSIMSKKIAAGANGIVLDVKVGSGAFMKTVEDARSLAEIMVQIGVDAGRDMVALISDMNQPLGYAVGNALEVAEAIDTMQGQGPADFRAHCIEAAYWMLTLAGQGTRWTDEAETRQTLSNKLDDGSALAAFRKMVEVQGGDASMVVDPSKLPQARYTNDVLAESDGYVRDVPADEVAWVSFDLGAGREKKGDPVDHAVGVKVMVKVGQQVEVGSVLATVYANNEQKLTSNSQRLQKAIALQADPVDPLPHFHGVITAEDV